MSLRVSFVNQCGKSVHAQCTRFYIVPVFFCDSLLVKILDVKEKCLYQFPLQRWRTLVKCLSLRLIDSLKTCDGWLQSSHQGYHVMTRSNVGCNFRITYKNDPDSLPQVIPGDARQVLGMTQK